MSLVSEDGTQDSPNCRVAGKFYIEFSEWLGKHKFYERDF